MEEDYALRHPTGGKAHSVSPNYYSARSVLHCDLEVG